MSHQRVNRKTLLSGIAAAALLGVLGLRRAPSARAETFEVHYSDAEWRKRLLAERFSILRQAGTEPPWSSKLEYEHRAGTYLCAGCDLALFDAKTKFESGTGWPSFYQALPNAVKLRDDYSLVEKRTEVICRRCGGHLGHVFDDGPKPTGLRYCMNGLALVFQPR